MKKAWICLLTIGIALHSCKEDDTENVEIIEEPSNIADQNANDDKAIAKYMDDHYLDTQGVIKAFSSTDASDDNYTKLSAMEKTTLDNGVIVIKRVGAQPDAATATAIGATDILRFMSKSTTFLSKVEKDNTVTYASEYSFRNTIDGSGVPEVDPYYYYVKKDVLEKATAEDAKKRSYYEIEGFQQGLQTFKSFNISDSSNFNLQGVIIVPSRAAYARDAHYTSTFRNRSFVFNFQVYKSTPRPASQQ